MAAAALGLPLWGLTSVIAIPLLSGDTQQWGAHQMRSHFPALMGWVLYGALLGLFSQAFTDLAARIFGPEKGNAPSIPPVKKRIVILGGGFAGMKTAVSSLTEAQPMAPKPATKFPTISSSSRWSRL